MSALRTLATTWLGALCGYGLFAAPGCGTDAVGVSECQDIERARCEASASCGTVDDVAACKRYYRDHCLHGLSAAAPSRTQVSDCVTAIKAAGACAADDEGVKLEDCGAPVPESAPGLRTACAFIARPERAEACAFLSPEPIEGTGGTPATDDDEEEPEAEGGANVGGTGGVRGD